MEKGRGNIVLFPYMARGHLLSFLALARRIHHMNYTVTFVNTPLNIKELEKSLDHGRPSSSIKLLEIPFNSSDHGLPPHSEDSDSLPYTLSLRLLQASSSLKLPFHNLLSTLTPKPIAVVSDTFFGWASDVTKELGIFHAVFSVVGGFGMACYCSMWLNFPHNNTANPEFQLPDFPEAGSFHVSQVTPAVLAAEEADSVTGFHRRNIQSWSNADALLFNTVEEIDSLGLTYFRRKLGIPAWGIGPLLPPEQGREATITAEQCTKWLDTKDTKSTIYISFGSHSTISPSQMTNLAKALDASGRSFVWVVRPPLGFDINAEFVAEQWLPEDLLQRVVRDEYRGLIVSKWAPQVEILGHRSVGAFISHCGWNSALEALENGVPLVGWPMAAEQFYNAKLLVEKVGVCVEVARGTSFEVRQEDIVGKIGLVMGESEKGFQIRKRCLEIREMLRDAVIDDENYKGSSAKAMHQFFNAALSKTSHT